MTTGYALSSPDPEPLQVRPGPAAWPGSEPVFAQHRGEVAHEALVGRHLDGVRLDRVVELREVALPPAPELVVQAVEAALDGEHEPGLVASRRKLLVALDRAQH